MQMRVCFQFACFMLILTLSKSVMLATCCVAVANGNRINHSNVLILYSILFFLRKTQDSSSAVVTLTTGLFWCVFILVASLKDAQCMLIDFRRQWWEQQKHICTWLTYYFLHLPFLYLIHRCVRPGFGSTTVMWPIRCPSTEVLKGWVFRTGNYF